MDKRILVIKTIGENELKSLFPLAPNDTSFVEYEEKNIYNIGNYKQIRELNTTFRGWALPFKKTMFNDDISLIETHINVGDNTNVLITCVYLDSSKKETILASKTLTKTGFITFEVDLPLTKMEEDFYIGFKVSEESSMMMSYVNSGDNNYIDYAKAIGDIKELYTIDTTTWAESSGGYRDAYISFNKKQYKEIAYKTDLPNLENHQSLNLFDKEFADKTHGAWWYGGKETTNEYTGSYYYTNKINVKDCENIYVQYFGRLEKGLYIGRYEFMNESGMVIKGGQAETLDIGKDIYLKLEVPEGASYVVFSFTKQVDDAFDVVTISKELLSEYVKYENYQLLKDLRIEKEQILNLDEEKIVIDLPDKYDLVVGDTFELFYEGIIKAKEPLKYNIEVECNIGNVYRRKFKVTPTQKGDHELSINVFDDYGHLVGSGKTQLVVKEEMTSPTKQTNILCIGDSLTANGVWVDEFCRRLVLFNDVTNEGANAPTGKGLSKIEFVGTKKTNSGYAKYEGFGGWNYSTYLDHTNENNPFAYDSTGTNLLGRIDFSSYCERIGSEIDIAYILLGWNSASEDETTYKAKALEFIQKIKDACPEVKIVLMGLQMPCLDGLGENYGATGVYSNYRTLQQYVINHNKWNKEIAQRVQGDFIQISGQFDSRYNCQMKDEKPNTRCKTSEKQGSNGVHPATEGYYQIADAAFRHFNNYHKQS